MTSVLNSYKTNTSCQWKTTKSRCTNKYSHPTTPSQPLPLWVWSSPLVRSSQPLSCKLAGWLACSRGWPGYPVKNLCCTTLDWKKGCWGKFSMPREDSQSRQEIRLILQTQLQATSYYIHRYIFCHSHPPFWQKKQTVAQNSVILTTLSRDIQSEIVYWGMVSQSSENNNVS